MNVANIEKLAQAIAQQEGFGADPANRPTRNHNPGDLRGWPGYPRDAEGFSVFPSEDVGWEKLHVDLMVHSRQYPQQTLAQFVAGDGKGWPGYAPASDGNDTDAYIRALALALDCPTYTTFGELC